MRPLRLGEPETGGARDGGPLARASQRSVCQQLKGVIDGILGRSRRALEWPRRGVLTGGGRAPAAKRDPFPPVCPRRNSREGEASDGPRRPANRDGGPASIRRPLEPRSSWALAQRRPSPSWRFSLPTRSVFGPCTRFTAPDKRWPARPHDAAKKRCRYSPNPYHPHPPAPPISPASLAANKDGPKSRPKGGWTILWAVYSVRWRATARHRPVYVANRGPRGASP